MSALGSGEGVKLRPRSRRFMCDWVRGLLDRLCM